MLTPAQNTVVTLKTTAGEEIIGYFVEYAGGEYKIRKPVTPVAMQDGMALAPYIMSSDYMETGEPVSFNSNGIVTVMKTSKMFADVYTKEVSGLQTSNQSKLIV